VIGDLTSNEMPQPHPGPAMGLLMTWKLLPISSLEKSTLDPLINGKLILSTTSRTCLPSAISLNSLQIDDI